jgi:hypothetical protein
MVGLSQLRLEAKRLQEQEIEREKIRREIELEDREKLKLKQYIREQKRMRGFGFSKFAGGLRNLNKSVKKRTGYSFGFNPNFMK